MKKISIITSGHPPYDERIFWKFALSFKESGFITSVICSTSNISIEEKGIILKGFHNENISKSEKINKLKVLLTELSPDYIICCEPLTIIAARRYRKSNNRKSVIISDVTEWYPENVALKYSGIKKYIIYAALFLFNAYVSNLTNAIIIGEKGKKHRYDFIAPLKKKIIIGYFPVLKYFEYHLPVIVDELVLCYAGLIKRDRGIIQLLKTAEYIAKKRNSFNVKIKLIGKFENIDEERIITEYISGIEDVKVEYEGWTSYDKISDYLRDVHICFDLRIKNFIYNNSLPIKIFEYMAAGKPFIYSDIYPVRKEFDYNKCGQLVNPEDLEGIADAVEKYCQNRELFSAHSLNGRQLVETEKNWERESQELIRFINGL